MGELQHVRIYMLFGNNNKFARTDIFKMKPKNSRKIRFILFL